MLCKCTKLSYRTRLHDLLGQNTVNLVPTGQSFISLYYAFCFHETVYKSAYQYIKIIHLFFRVTSLFFLILSASMNQRPVCKLGCKTKWGSKLIQYEVYINLVQSVWSEWGSNSWHSARWRLTNALDQLDNIIIIRLICTVKSWSTSRCNVSTFHIESDMINLQTHCFSQLFS